MFSTLTSVLVWCIWQYLRILFVLLSLIGLLSWASLIRHGPIAKLNYVIKFSLSFFCCLVGIYFALPHILIRPRNLYSARIVSWFVKVTTKINGVTYEVRSSKILEEDRGAIVVLNHQSLLDGLVYTNLVPILKVATGIMKKELLYIFPIGQLTWLGGGVFVDRSSPKAAYRTLSNCVEKIHRDKMKALIFPEGTRNPVRGFLPFKKGAFKAAILGQLPIIPVVISPYYFIDHQKKEFRPGHVILQALEPICTKGMSDADCDQLIEKTRSVMLAEYERLSAEVDQMSMKKEWREKKRPQVFADGKGL